MQKILGLGLMLLSSLTQATPVVCQKSQDCNDGQACISYTNCQKGRSKRCLNRTCYRSGVNCPGRISCHNKHCGEVGPCLDTK